MSTYNYTPRHRRPEILQELVDQGLSRTEMATELRVGETTVMTWCRRLGIETPKTGMPEKLVSAEIQEPEIETDETHCPECARNWADKAEQQACMRKHARDKADFLAAHGEAIL